MPYRSSGPGPQGSGAGPSRPDNPAPPSPLDRIKARAIEAQVIEVLRSTHDPEIPVNIYDLGLVYDIDVTSTGEVMIQMTLTSPACPVAESLPVEVESRVRAIDGVSNVNVQIVWDPPWTPDRMSETAKLELGFM